MGDKDNDLPLLNERETELVHQLASGVGVTESYRRAYDTDGYGPGALAVEASRKVNSEKIQLHMKALRAISLTKAALTLQDRIKSELEFAQRCEDKGAYSAAGQAHDRANKMLGLYVEKLNVELHKEHDPAETLEQIAQIDPDIAAFLSRKHNLKPDDRSVN